MEKIERASISVKTALGIIIIKHISIYKKDEFFNVESVNAKHTVVKNDCQISKISIYLNRVV